jgi:hypothetical protein
MASSLPINSSRNYGAGRPAGNQPRGNEESQEGCEEMVTPFHTAKVQVNGLLKEVGHAIRGIQMCVAMPGLSLNALAQASKK